jgi:polysaccharide biosynthesis/export protein
MGANGCATVQSAKAAAVPSPRVLHVGSSPQLVQSLYTLVPDDVIEITVYGYPELSKQVRVLSGGDFVYPPLGTVQVAGLTVAQLEKWLTQQLQKGHLIHPPVVVTVKERHNRHIYVLGAVRSPGVYTLRDNASLLDLIAQADGLTLEAAPYILVYRGEAVSRHQVRAASMRFKGMPSIRIDLRTLVSGERVVAVQIRSGDTVYVPRRASYDVFVHAFLQG